MKLRRHIFMFQKRFAPLVAAGTKRQTIRRLRKRVPALNDIIEGREWSGLPYRSKQRVLRRGVCLGSKEVSISAEGVTIWAGCVPVDAMFSFGPSSKRLEAFARADGFEDWRSMREWFQQTHGLPFKGMVTMWKP